MRIIPERIARKSVRKTRLTSPCRPLLQSGAIVAGVCDSCVANANAECALGVVIYVGRIAGMTFRIASMSETSLLSSLLAVSGGAAFGASLRWWVSSKLNTLLPHLPPGTLLVNLLGGFLIGIAVEVFLRMPHLSPHLRLFIITGFLGGLTTFSSFSAEMITSLQKGHTLWVLGGITLHLGGSLLMTVAGMSLTRLLWPQ